MHAIGTFLFLLFIVCQVLGNNHSHVYRLQATSSRNCDCLPNTMNRIIGGELASITEYPWQASLGLKITSNRVEHICGATILNEFWVMTAAHCARATNNVSDMLVGVGSNNLRTMSVTKRIPVIEAIIHPNYNPIMSDSKGDIALLRLSHAIPFNRKTKPGCLYPNLKKLNDILEDTPLEVTATGWGSVNKTYKWILGNALRGGRVQPFLKKATFFALNSKAKSSCRNRDDLLCITPRKRGDSACNGDSGGPLNYAFDEENEGQSNLTKSLNEVINTNTLSSFMTPQDNFLNENLEDDENLENNNNNSGYLSHFSILPTPSPKVAIIGVTSFGVGTVQLPNILKVYFCTGPAAYTRVPYYNDFIENSIGKDNLCYA